MENIAGFFGGLLIFAFGYWQGYRRAKNEPKKYQRYHEIEETDGIAHIKVQVPTIHS